MASFMVSPANFHIIDTLEVHVPSVACGIWRAGDRILIVGTGDGEVARYLQYKYGLTTTTVNVTNEWTPSQIGRKTAATFDQAMLPVGDLSYDVVIFKSVVHQVAQRAPDQVREVRRVARKWVILMEDDNTRETRTMKQQTHAVGTRLRARDPKAIFRGQCELVRLLEQGGEFSVVAVGVQQPIGSQDPARSAQRYFVVERRTHGGMHFLPSFGEADNGQGDTQINRRLHAYEVRARRRLEAMGLRQGHCNALPIGPPQHELPSQCQGTSGKWLLPRRTHEHVDTMLQPCMAKCAQCAECGFVSFAVDETAAPFCAWYSTCAEQRNEESSSIFYWTAARFDDADSVARRRNRPSAQLLKEFGAAAFE